MILIRLQGRLEKGRQIPSGGPHHVLGKSTVLILEEVDELAARNCWRESWTCGGVMVEASYDVFYVCPIR